MMEPNYTLNEKELFEDKVVAVTGGLGSIGSEIIKKLMKNNPKKIILIDNRETSLFYSMLDNPKVVHKMVDVRDYGDLSSALRGVDILFHAAAMKHVIMCEEFPHEAIKTNVIGTKNAIDASIENNIKKMILISTDKAANPMNVMGTTKLLAEKLVGAVATSKNRGNTEFGIIRFGNVLYSRGSVLEVWNKQLNTTGRITLTDENMTRFFMSLSQCVNLIFTATKLAKEGEIFILKGS
jgi:UDP-N-acetylglucosamine 4,6-dehydratase